MNSLQFKAWFKGFAENIGGVPNEKQWARIQERVGQIGLNIVPRMIINNTPHGLVYQDDSYNAGALEAQEVASNV